MKRTARNRFLLIALVAGLSAGATGCQSSSRLTGPVRAIWVTRFDYKSPGDVKRIMEDCAEGGFNTVLFQARGNGTVSYSSKLEPWAEQYDFRNPGFDPLATAIREAHARDLKLHAWVNVMPAWRGPGEPRAKNQLYHTHPEWFWYDAHGKRQPIHHQVGGKQRDWYVSLNPCLPEVRKYLVDVFHELVANYDVDGLHMDYIRFPNERVVPGEKIPDYPRDHRTLALFRQDTGQTPASDPPAWNAWRTAQVTKLVTDIRAMMRRTRPGAALTSAVGSVRKNGLTHFQDGKTWLERDLVDAVFLMNYTSSPDKFEKRIQPWLAIKTKGRIIPGLSITDKPDVARGAAAARQEIEIARSLTGDFCVFAYSSLFDSKDREFSKQNEAISRKRALRRKIILRYVRKLAPRDRTI